MKYIECKAQWFSRPLTTKTAMSGFEGPAAKTELDDGYGVPMMKGMLTPSYQCFFEETGRVNNSPVYDGTINIPDTKANRYKIAQHVRSRDLRVVDRNAERAILSENPPVSRELAPKQRNLIAEMPEDFDGSKVVIRSSTMAIVDPDPIEDPHAAVQDAQFTEVKTAPVNGLAVASAVAADMALTEEKGSSIDKTAETAVALDTVLRAPAVSIAQAQAGQVAKPATEAPKGFDAKALRARADQARTEASQDKSAAQE
jgi:hypothetical protein